jgi:hypothetical protein
VTRIRASKLCRLAALAGALGCAGSSSSPLLTIPGVKRELSADAAHDAGPRRPDGVVVEPPPALPNAAEHADTRGVVALREPLGGDALREVVFAVVEAWERESLEQLVALLSDDAGPIEARSRGRSALIESFRQRLHAHEYRRLAGVNLVRAERIERYAWNDLSAADAPARPPEMRPDELFVRVPLEVTRAAGERLFGDMMLLLVRREEGGYKIAAYGEADGQ